VIGGVAGGVQGGTVGGEVGGVLGGQIGGVQGGTVGGVVGGTVGGTGTGTAGEGTGGVEAPPAGPMRVGGDVKAPVVTRRVEPTYPEVARKARVAGVVVVEAIIDKQGNVDQVRVLKGLPMGLSGEAEAAVRKWKFRPGTLNGQPVDVIFSLTVTFTLGGDVN
jgi:protein TonB